MSFFNIFQPGFRLIEGSLLNKIFNGQITVPAMSITSLTASTQSVPAQTVGNLTVTGTAAITGNTTAGNVSATTLTPANGASGTLNLGSTGNVTVTNGIITAIGA